MPTKSTQPNAAQIDLKKNVQNLDFPKIIDLSKLHAIETTKFGGDKLLKMLNFELGYVEM